MSSLLPPTEMVRRFLFASSPRKDKRKKASGGTLAAVDPNSQRRRHKRNKHVPSSSLLMSTSLATRAYSSTTNTHGDKKKRSVESSSLVLSSVGNTSSAKENNEKKRMPSGTSLKQHSDSMKQTTSGLLSLADSSWNRSMKGKKNKPPPSSLLAKGSSQQNALAVVFDQNTQQQKGLSLLGTSSPDCTSSTKGNLGENNTRPCGSVAKKPSGKQVVPSTLVQSQGGSEQENELPQVTATKSSLEKHVPVFLALNRGYPSLKLSQSDMSSHGNRSIGPPTLLTSLPVKVCSKEKQKHGGSHTLNQVKRSKKSSALVVSSLFCNSSSKESMLEKTTRTLPSRRSSDRRTLIPAASKEERRSRGIDKLRQSSILKSVHYSGRKRLRPSSLLLRASSATGERGLESKQHHVLSQLYNPKKSIPSTLIQKPTGRTETLVSMMAQLDVSERKNLNARKRAEHVLASPKHQLNKRQNCSKTPQQNLDIPIRDKNELFFSPRTQLPPSDLEDTNELFFSPSAQLPTSELQDLPKSLPRTIILGPTEIISPVWSSHSSDLKTPIPCEIGTDMQSSTSSPRSAIKESRLFNEPIKLDLDARNGSEELIPALATAIKRPVPNLSHLDESILACLNSQGTLSNVNVDQALINSPTTCEQSSSRREASVVETQESGFQSRDDTGSHLHVSLPEGGEMAIPPRCKGSTQVISSQNESNKTRPLHSTLLVDPCVKSRKRTDQERAKSQELVRIKRIQAAANLKVLSLVQPVRTQYSLLANRQTAPKVSSVGELSDTSTKGVTKQAKAVDQPDFEPGLLGIPNHQDFVLNQHKVDVSCSKQPVHDHPSSLLIDRQAAPKVPSLSISANHVSTKRANKQAKSDDQPDSKEPVRVEDSLSSSLIDSQTDPKVPSVSIAAKVSTKRANKSAKSVDQPDFGPILLGNPNPQDYVRNQRKVKVSFSTQPATVQDSLSSLLIDETVPKVPSMSTESVTSKRSVTKPAKSVDQPDFGPILLGNLDPQDYIRNQRKTDVSFSKEAARIQDSLSSLLIDRETVPKVPSMSTESVTTKERVANPAMSVDQPDFRPILWGNPNPQDYVRNQRKVDVSFSTQPATVLDPPSSLLIDRQTAAKVVPAKTEPNVSTKRTSKQSKSHDQPDFGLSLLGNPNIQDFVRKQLKDSVLSSVQPVRVQDSISSWVPVVNCKTKPEVSSEHKQTSTSNARATRSNDQPTLCGPSLLGANYPNPQDLVRVQAERDENRSGFVSQSNSILAATGPTCEAPISCAIPEEPGYFKQGGSKCPEPMSLMISNDPQDFVRNGNPETSPSMPIVNNSIASSLVQPDCEPSASSDETLVATSRKVNIGCPPSVLGLVNLFAPLEDYKHPRIHEGSKNMSMDPEEPTSLLCRDSSKEEPKLEHNNELKECRTCSRTRFPLQQASKGKLEELLHTQMELRRSSRRKVAPPLYNRDVASVDESLLNRKAQVSKLSSSPPEESKHVPNEHTSSDPLQTEPEPRRLHRSRKATQFYIPGESLPLDTKVTDTTWSTTPSREAGSGAGEHETGESVSRIPTSSSAMMIPTPRPFQASQDEPDGGGNRRKLGPLALDQLSFDDNWTCSQVTQLKQAQGVADPSDTRFWWNVALQVDGKDANECCEKWFSFVKTPVAKRSKISKDAQQEACFDDDDIFNFTPFRDIETETHSEALSRGVGSMCLDTAFLSQGTQQQQQQEEFAIPLPNKVGFKKYIQEMRRDISRNKNCAQRTTRRRRKRRLFHHRKRQQYLA